MASDLLRTKLFLRGKHGIESLWGPPSSSQEDVQVEKHDSFDLPQADVMVCSPDGRSIVLVSTDKGFSVRDTQTGHVSIDMEHSGIQAMAWSPKGSYLISWQRPVKDSDDGNLIVWDAATGAIVTRFQQKTYARDKWPSLQWSSDEAICARLSNNGVVVYNGSNLASGPVGSVNQPGTTVFSVAPGKAPYKLALFVPEKKGKPASVRVYQFPSLDTCVASKSFYRAQEVTLKWNPTGQSVIIQTHTDVDASGKSYYGESGLFFLQADGQYDCIVPLTKEGGVHDVQWDPTGKVFVVLAGAMPCHATLYDSRAVPTFEFGAAPRNTVSWSPHGRFLCLAGFGNLRGDMDFWDRNKLKKMGSTNAHAATTYGWSPDSRYFCTATTFPRLRVDNGWKLFRYDGSGPVLTDTRAELYDVVFRPAAKGVYPNRPQSPRRNGAEATTAKAPEKPKAYRPPNSTGALAALMKQEESGSKKLDRNKYTPPNAGASVPGMAPKAIPGMAPAGPKKPSKSQKKKKAKEAKQAQEAAEQALGATSAPACTAHGLTDAEKKKKSKALSKKLKRIDEIKDKQASGAELNADQVHKLSTEEELRKELEALHS